MIETLKKFKYLIIIVIIIIVAFVAYTIYTSGSPANDSTSLQKTTAGATASGPGSVLPSSNSSIPNNDLANSFVDQLLTIQSINLKIDFFSDPVFVDLKDNHIDIQSQPISRPNPFAPIGQDTGQGSGKYQFIDGTVGGSVPAGVFDSSASKTTSVDNTASTSSPLPSSSSKSSSSKTKKATTTTAQ